MTDTTFLLSTVVPGLCRQSLEAACIEVVRRRRLTRGEPHAEVDALLESNTKLLPRLALALFDDPQQAGQVLRTLNNTYGHWSGDVVQACNRGAPRWNPDAVGRARPRQHDTRAQASQAPMRARQKDSPEQLVKMARALLATPQNGARGMCSRAAAPARQALEGALDAFWKERAPGMEVTSARAQLICLPVFLRDQETAGQIAYAWAALSRACHHHGYELAPAVAEIRGWIDVVENLTERLQSRVAIVNPIG